MRNLVRQPDVAVSGTSASGVGVGLPPSSLSRGVGDGVGLPPSSLSRGVGDGVGVGVEVDALIVGSVDVTDARDVGVTKPSSVRRAGLPAIPE